jgi:hypothetical protein
MSFDLNAEDKMIEIAGQTGDSEEDLLALFSDQPAADAPTEQPIAQPVAQPRTSSLEEERLQLERERLEFERARHQEAIANAAPQRADTRTPHKFTTVDDEVGEEFQGYVTAELSREMAKVRAEAEEKIRRVQEELEARKKTDQDREEKSRVAAKYQAFGAELQRTPLFADKPSLFEAIRNEIYAPHNYEKYRSVISGVDIAVANNDIAFAESLFERVIATKKNARANASVSTQSSGAGMRTVKAQADANSLMERYTALQAASNADPRSTPKFLAAQKAMDDYLAFVRGA